MILLLVLLAPSTALALDQTSSPAAATNVDITISMDITTSLTLQVRGGDDGSAPYPGNTNMDATDAAIDFGGVYYGMTGNATPDGVAYMNVGEDAEYAIATFAVNLIMGGADQNATVTFDQTGGGLPVGVIMVGADGSTTAWDTAASPGNDLTTGAPVTLTGAAITAINNDSDDAPDGAWADCEVGFRFPSTQNDAGGAFSATLRFTAAP